MEIVVVLTSRCNAQCTHCTTSCGPRARQALSDAMGCSADWIGIADQATGFDWRQIS